MRSPAVHIRYRVQTQKKSQLFGGLFLTYKFGFDKGGSMSFETWGRFYFFDMVQHPKDSATNLLNLFVA
jgi:hypothetical protein